MIKLTYDEYDRIEAVCERIKQINEETYPDEMRLFSGRYQYPTVEQVCTLNMEEHLEDFFLFLMYWYTQRFDNLFGEAKDEYKDYQESMAYIKKIIDRNIEFVDDEEEDNSDEEKELTFFEQWKAK